MELPRVEDTFASTIRTPLETRRPRMSMRTANRLGVKHINRGLGFAVLTPCYSRESVYIHSGAVDLLLKVLIWKFAAVMRCWDRK